MVGDTGVASNLDEVKLFQKGIIGSDNLLQNTKELLFTHQVKYNKIKPWAIQESNL